MSANAAQAIVYSVLILSVTSCIVAGRYAPPPDPVVTCVKNAWTNADRVACLQAKEQSK